ncbi:MAG: SIMPL domain-containing protein [Magnetospirillum sp.]|jgi:predicted secreted protein|nr:SIMPL domain-containing protein [Magnetospirillum sp.]
MLRPALLALCLLTLPAAAAEPPVLTLGESAERAIQQDRLTVALRAEATGPTAAGVQAEINRRMEAAVARARQSAGVSVETGAYWTHEERPQNQPRRWRGAATLELSGSDMAALTALAGALQEGGMAMSGLRFDLRRETARAAEDELTAEALQRLKLRAERAADALGLRVTGYRAIRLGAAGGEAPPRPMPRAAMADLAAANAPAPIAEPGRATVRVSVEADVLLGPK